MTLNSWVIHSHSLKLAALLGLASGCASSVAEPTGVSGPKTYVFESDTSAFNTRTVFYDNGEEVVAFDAQFTPGAAIKALDFIKSKTSNPVTHLVVTHPNPDKFNGITVFREAGAMVTASHSTARSMPDVHAYKKAFFVGQGMFKDDTYPHLSLPEDVFETSRDLVLRNGERILLRELPEPGVSSNQTVAYIPTVRSVIVGDLVHSGVHAWLEGGIVNGRASPTIRGWIADLGTLKNLFGDCRSLTVYGGRGIEANLCKGVEDEITYLKKADQLVSQYVKDLGPARSELSGPLASRHYQELQHRFETAFPGLGLSYLIQYGVYGLANAKASQL